jgi:phosphoenolpyruvate carboxykinase (GTP)
MGDYFQHWLNMGKALSHPPRIFGVNWFRKGSDGKFMWPGYGENMRVLEWIIGRVKEVSKGKETEIGTIPNYSDLNWNGMEMSEQQFESVSRIDRDEWLQELELQSELIAKLNSRIPKRFHEIHKTLTSRFDTRNGVLKSGSASSLML